MNHNISRRDFNKLLLTGAAGASFGLFGAPGRAFGASKRVVVIGGGFGGAAAAKYLRKLDPSISVTLVEPKSIFYTCPFSNWVLGGIKTMNDLAQNYTVLKNKYQVNVIADTAVAVDAYRSTVRLAGGTTLGYDRLIVAPGIDFKYEAIPRKYPMPTRPDLRPSCSRSSFLPCAMAAGSSSARRPIRTAVRRDHTNGQA
jgi:sulfide dehydrogenase [flavocytochrome c] flavoprotein subunit